MLGLGQACSLRKARSHEQLGAESLDRNLGDIHTWPHSQTSTPVDNISTQVDLRDKTAHALSLATKMINIIP